MCVHVCIYTYIYIYVYTHTHTRFGPVAESDGSKVGPIVGWIRSFTGSGQRKVAYDWSGQSSWSVNLVGEGGLGSEVGQ